MPALTTAEQHPNASVGSPATHLIDMEVHLRAAGRLAELVGVCDPDVARLAGICFRMASRIRGDRLRVAA